MVEVEVDPGESGVLPEGLDAERVRTLCNWAFAAAGVDDGHASVSIVEAGEIHELNREHRGVDRPTDVLSFPVDGAGPAAGPRELGDVVVCPEHCESVTRAIVHGALHLVDMDHETDAGEMLSLIHI